MAIRDPFQKHEKQQQSDMFGEDQETESAQAKYSPSYESYREKIQEEQDRIQEEKDQAFIEATNEQAQQEQQEQEDYLSSGEFLDDFEDDTDTQTPPAEESELEYADSGMDEFGFEEKKTFAINNKDPNNIPSMRSYLSVPGYVQGIFELHHASLTNDKKNKENKVLDSGIDFLKHLEKLKNSFSDLQQAIQNVKIETNNNLPVGENFRMYLFLAVEGGDPSYKLKSVRVIPQKSNLARASNKGKKKFLDIPAKHFSKNSIWRTPSALGYVVDMDLLRAVCTGSDRARKLAACGYSGIPQVTGLDPRALDYLAFSAHFHKISSF